MAIRTIREERDEILKKVSRPVEKIDEKIQILIDDMLETMHKFNGVGLAAVQVGVLKRVVVIHIDYEKDETWQHRYGYLKNGPWYMVHRRRPGMGRRP